MYPKWLNQLADNFEKLLIWLAEGGKNPFDGKRGSEKKNLSIRDPEKRG